MQETELILFDIPSKGRCACWSPNSWKTRCVLNYKQIPYKTSWLEYPDIAPKLSKFGLQPHPPGSWSDYSCPTIRLPDGEYIMDSQRIVEKLEKLHPEPKLHLETGIHEAVRDAIKDLIGALKPPLFLGAQRNILREPSTSWFAEDRARRFGKSLEQMDADEGGEKAWEAAQPGLNALSAELSKHKRDHGPFILGREVCYGDFFVAGFFDWVKKADATVYERMMEYDANFKPLCEACQPWMAKDD